MLGTGIYKISDAARYVGLSPATLRSWFKPRGDRKRHEPIFTGDYPVIDGDYAISFVNLIEAYVGRAFREKGVGSDTLRRAYVVLQHDMGTPHPFAHAHLSTDGRAIIRKTADLLNGTELTDVISKQRLFKEVEAYLTRIDYGTDDLASSWRIAEGVTIDPQHSLGKPVISQIGIATYVLANQLAANNDDAELVADLFGIRPDQVLNAAAFEKDLRKRKVA
jgi:uncharacterized protein (DUF433 family)